MYFNTVNDVKVLSRDTGYFFFTPDTMAAFNSKVYEGIYGGKYFITSEKPDSDQVWGGQRRFTIREASYDDRRFRIVTVGDFGQYASHDEAKTAVLDM